MRRNMSPQALVLVIMMAVCLWEALSISNAKASCLKQGLSIAAPDGFMKWRCVK
jgi:hypothetical protein